MLVAEVTANVLHEDDVGIIVLPSFDSISIFLFQVDMKHTDTQFFNVKLNEIFGSS